MRFQLGLLILAAAFVKADEDAVLSVILQDIESYQSDYLSYIQEGHAVPSGVLQVYQQITTYTDDSYTTLYSQIDESAVATFITGVPWYSSRLASKIAAAETEGDSSIISSSESGSASAESTSASASASASASESTSESASASASTSASASASVSSSKASEASSSSKASSSASASSASSTSSANGAANVEKSLAYLVGPIVALGALLL